MTLNNRAFWSQDKTAQVQQRLVYTMECTRASPEMGVKACLKEKNKKCILLLSDSCQSQTFVLSQLSLPHLLPRKTGKLRHFCLCFFLLLFLHTPPFWFCLRPDWKQVFLNTKKRAVRESFQPRFVTIKVTYLHYIKDGVSVIWISRAATQ